MPYEHQWLSIYNDILNYGVIKTTRNAITKSVNDVSIKIDLNDGFPITTLKKTYWKGIVEELLWIINGQTDVSILQNKNIHIWDKNSSQTYLDSIGSNLSENDIGPGYGFQMRFSGAKYINCKTDYNSQGNDQLIDCINQIKNNPHSRRIIINLWNVFDLNAMALPPCHLLYQFTVTNDKLNCHLYQRSWDMLLGWNTSTAALLTHIIANHCGLHVGILTHTISDCHIYLSHDVSVDGNTDILNYLNSLVPYKLPSLHIKNKHDCINDYIFDDFELCDYNFHKSIKLNMIE
jgi:thymidylate synthase